MVSLKEAVSYKNMGEKYLIKGNYKTARSYFVKALSCLRKLRAAAIPELKSIWDEPIAHMESVIQRLNEIISGRREARRDEDFDLPDFRVGLYVVLDEIMKAKKILRIASPWFSKSIIKDIMKKLGKHGVKFYIMTRPLSSTTNKSQADAVRYLSNMMLRHPDQVFVKFFKNLHAKMVIIDKSTLITGSFNMTVTGLYRNIEYINIEKNPVKVKQAIQNFDTVWASS